MPDAIPAAQARLALPLGQPRTLLSTYSCPIERLTLGPIPAYSDTLARSLVRPVEVEFGVELWRRRDGRLSYREEVACNDMLAAIAFLRLHQPAARHWRRTLFTFAELTDACEKWADPPPGRRIISNAAVPIAANYLRWPDRLVRRGRFWMPGVAIEPRPICV